MNKKFNHKKSLGQYFLKTVAAAEKIATAADLKPDDLVVEVGPGTGALTKALFAKGVRVLALEADKRAIAVLRENFATELKAKQLTIIHTDVRELDLSTLPIIDHEYKVVANIPYYLSGFLFRTFLDSTVQPSRLVFLVQKEVAERIATDAKESLLSLAVKIFGQPIYIAEVGRENFDPVPGVDSAILAVTDINRNAFAEVNKEDFFKLLRYGFATKRKQLSSNLSKHYPKPIVQAVFNNLNLPPNIRAEAVPVKTWLQLAINLKKNHK